MARVVRLRIIPALTAAAVFVLMLAVPARADVNFTRGGAFGESVDVTLAGTDINSGPTPVVTLPPTGGGPFTDNLAQVDLPDALLAQVLQVSTEGALGPAGFVESSADVANVRIGPAASPVLEATAVHSECRADSLGSTGTASLASLEIGGEGGALEPPPNTVIPVPGVGEIRLNEQISSSTRGEEEGVTNITVNAIHVVFDGPLGTGDIIISQSRCEVQGPNVVIPEVAIAVLLPLSALLLFGGYYYIVRRRRAAQ